jgi:hypothetical protein
MSTSYANLADGPPTTQLLRWRNGILDVHTKERYDAVVCAAMQAQWIIETLVPSMYAGVFQCRVSRGRVFNFLATVSSWAWLTPERSAPLG